MHHDDYLREGVIEISIYFLTHKTGGIEFKKLPYEVKNMLDDPKLMERCDELFQNLKDDPPNKKIETLASY